MFKNKKKKCKLCNIDSLNNEFCRDCSKIKLFIRQYGMKLILDYIEKPIFLSPTAPYPPPHQLQ